MRIAAIQVAGPPRSAFALFIEQPPRFSEHHRRIAAPQIFQLPIQAEPAEDARLDAPGFLRGFKAFQNQPIAIRQPVERRAQIRMPAQQPRLPRVHIDDQKLRIQVVRGPTQRRDRVTVGSQIRHRNHAAAIAKFGGSDGIRDLALLESAVAAPQASFGGKSPYADLPEVAAAYLYYLCKNHPFIDGNKRTAFGACIVFLRLNGIEPKADRPEWEELVLAIAAGTMDRDEATVRLRCLLPKDR